MVTMINISVLPAQTHLLQLPKKVMIHAATTEQKPTMQQQLTIEATKTTFDNRKTGTTIAYVKTGETRTDDKN